MLDELLLTVTYSESLRDVYVKVVIRFYSTLHVSAMADLPAKD